MRPITCKFGGTSLADVGAIQRAVDIIRENTRRRYIVPSAPGKRYDDDQKVTDLLYAWHEVLHAGADDTDLRMRIAERFRDLAAGLEVQFPVDAYIEEIAEEAKTDDSPDFMVSRGEYLNGRLLAQLLNATFIDPQQYILLDEDGHHDPVSYERLGEALQGEGLFVVPGFYGALENGQVKTFSRGGSDITGAIVARATKSGLYENWTDVAGFRMTDPRIVPHAGRMAEVTYREMRELAYMGASVFHEEAMFPVQEVGIPIQIKSTLDPDAPGTAIVSERVATELVCGIAGRKGFSSFNLESRMQDTKGTLVARLLMVLESDRVPVEHIATGIDCVSVVVRDEDIEGKENELLAAIDAACQPEALELERGIAIIATVGQGMEGKVGMAARLCQALAREGISIEIIDQGSPENNIIVGVAEANYEHAVRAIYDEFAMGEIGRQMTPADPPLQKPEETLPT